LFNTDLVLLPISVHNAEVIFNNALAVLKGEIPECAEGCEYCRWGRECGGIN